MSLKDWKNKELNENLNKKWGFKMNLNEMGMGAGPMDPMGGEGSMEGEPPMNQEDVRVEQCIEEKIMMMQPKSPCEEADIRKSCEEEMQSAMAQEDPSIQRNTEMPFQESLKKKIRVKFKK
jgi:hypothetical protein